jgi:hypothetical protein
VGFTLNICLGHQPFPEAYTDHVDIFLTCKRLYGQNRSIYLDDAMWGPHGGALSEYAQLFWLSDNFDRVVGDAEFVRIFQYRRFISRHGAGRDTNAPYISQIRIEELSQFAADFSRVEDEELFSRPFQFGGGMLGQFAPVHPLDDLLAVVRFLLGREHLSPAMAAAFLREEYLIPACNMGVFRRETLKTILEWLRPVGDYLQSPDFVAREGYNRRSLGFILERLHSFIILDLMRSGQAPQNFGNHIVMSEINQIGVTIGI